MVTGIVENDKERRARLMIWEVMAKSLVGAEVSTICKMCPIHGDIAYVYTKVREWAESVNPFHYFTSVKNYFTKIYDDWPTVESLVFDVTQAAEELDRMGAALKVKPWATGLKHETVITQLLLRFQNDPEEFKYLNEIVLRLWDDQSKVQSREARKYICTKGNPNSGYESSIGLGKFSGSWNTVGKCGTRSVIII
jgi:hypothetical protein